MDCETAVIHSMRVFVNEWIIDVAVFSDTWPVRLMYIAIESAMLLTSSKLRSKLTESRDIS